MSTERDRLVRRFLDVRSATDRLTAPLSPEDQQVQSMPQASPAKWHRAHTTWFFETFVLAPAGVEAFDSRFGYLFNSYYDAVGDRVARPKRGLMSRPTAAEIGDYRRAVDERVVALLQRLDEPELTRLAPVLDLGFAHEEQHQELILTDILSLFSENPLAPVYRRSEPLPSTGAAPASPRSAPPTWQTFDGGLTEIGAPPTGFAFDNERPRHWTLVPPFALAARLVTVGEVRAFIEARGYETASLWLSEGYETVRTQGWRAPLYTRCEGAAYETFTLRGWRCPGDDEPACHLSFWEAEAIARFLDARLPTEAEWEHAARGVSPDEGNFADGPLVPQASPAAGPNRLFGDVWQWTRSSYAPFPGYRVAPGALGEYNGKFMAQQFVLRGGSCLTPRGHVRPSYRNFWHPDTRFQMTGVRLARDL